MALYPVKISRAQGEVQSFEFKEANRKKNDEVDKHYGCIQ